MGRQGGQGKGKPKLKDKYFGKAIINQLKNANYTAKATAKMNSILDNSTLDDFIISAEMDENAAEVVRVHDKDAYLAEPTVKVFQSMNLKQYDHEHLQIPRKPAWTTEMTAEEIDRNEKNAFLDWRRSLAIMESSNYHRKVTPYEKNLEVWRQLWRVMERSDIAVQIVDARNPLLYYTQNLTSYAAELKPAKPIMLLINKSDFLSEYQRLQWLKYFQSHGIAVAFYSAFMEQERIDIEVKEPSDESVNPAIDVDFIDCLVDDIVACWLSDLNSFAKSSNKKIIKKSIPTQTITPEIPLDKPIEDTVEFVFNNEEIKPLSNELNKIDDNSNKDKCDEEDNEDNDDGFVDYDNDDEDSYDDENNDEDDSGEGNGSDEEYDDDVYDDEIDVSTLIPVDDKNIESNTKPTFQQSIQIRSTSEYYIDRERAKILTRFELIDLLSKLPKKLNIRPQARHQNRVCVGMLGYPNVGKSSVINTILGVSKSSHGVVRVAVSSTPGKTKHFQTLIVNNELILCDCPGLVFPSFMNSTGDMICAGILPINQMRDYTEPAAIIATKVPMHILDAIYGMHIKKVLDFKDNPDRPPTGSEVLSAYCVIKGYITNGTGRWDEFRACKEILRDFNDGKILYACPPPLEDESIDMDRWQADTENITARNERIAERLAIQRLLDIETEAKNEVDALEKALQSAKLDTVFGEGDIIYDDDSSNDEEESEINTQSIITNKTEKREHKRLKHWGKKNKKLRDKNPYSEENGVISYVAYSTNRSQLGNLKQDKSRRHDPRNAYGVPFVRPINQYTSNISTLSTNSKIKLNA